MGDRRGQRATSAWRRGRCMGDDTPDLDAAEVHFNLAWNPDDCPKCGKYGKALVRRVRELNAEKQRMIDYYHPREA